MLRFVKKRADIDGTESGDFYGFDASMLGDILKPLNARCDTNEVEITVYPIDATSVWNEQDITDAVLLHGSQEQMAVRESNKIIKEKIYNLEAQQTPRRIREALHDNSWMLALESQIAALRAQLK